MKKNVGNVDMVIRLVIAAVIAILYFTKAITGILGLVLIIVAIIFAVTAFIGYCPLYSIFGFRTTVGKKTVKKS